MIKFNNREHEWKEGLTVEELMQMNNFTYSRIIVSKNSSYVQPEDYGSTMIHDGDDVKAIHLLAGG